MRSYCYHFVFWHTPLRSLAEREPAWDLTPVEDFAGPSAIEGTLVRSGP